MGICSEYGTIRYYISHFQQSRFIKPDRFEDNPAHKEEIQDYQKALFSLDSTSLEVLRRDLKKQRSDDGRRIILTESFARTVG